MVSFQSTDTTAPINRGLDFSNSTTIKMETDTVHTGFSNSSTPSSTPNSVSKVLPVANDIKAAPIK